MLPDVLHKRSSLVQDRVSIRFKVRGASRLGGSPRRTETRVSIRFKVRGASRRATLFEDWPVALVFQSALRFAVLPDGLWISEKRVTFVFQSALRFAVLPDGAEWIAVLGTGL